MAFQRKVCDPVRVLGSKRQSLAFVYAAKMRRFSLCVYQCVSLRWPTHTHGEGRGGEGCWMTEYSSVWLNQTFLLSLTMMTDDE